VNYVIAAGSGSSPGGTVAGFALIVAGIVLYILPSLVASYRRCDKLSPVVVVNIFLGWTVIGWIVALAMAVSGPSRRPRKVPPPYRWQQPR
jgi:hypothetical protein